MKKNKFKEFTNKKGFMIAVYSCAAIVIAMTSIIASNKDEKGAKDEIKSEQVEQANQSDVKSYRENQITGNSALGSSGLNNLTASEEKITEKASQRPEKTTQKTTNERKQNPSENKNDTNENSENKKEEKSADAEKPPKTDFVLFDDSKEMSWPLSGQIVMDFSMETAIYDKTLDQYRTNNSVCISGDVGDNILASADGKVKSVSKDKENLTSVTIEHGNGWLSTYSQLQDNVLVKEGDIVDEGTVIGNLSEPSYKSSLLGPHLEFKITHNDEYTDPKIILSQEE